jgi:hypothetical protein
LWCRACFVDVDVTSSGTATALTRCWYLVLQDCADHIARNEGMAILMQLCSCEKPAVLRFATVALANMTALARVQRTLVDERAVAVLSMCSDTKNYVQIRQCAQAFYNLTCRSVAVGV